MHADEGDLVLLAHALAEAKRDEDAAKQRRIAAEEALIRAAGFAKPEGQSTYQRQTGAGSCSFTLKQPITTSVDTEAWLELRRKLSRSHPARAVFREKFELDTKAARELQEKDPKAWAEAARVVTRRPGKVSVELKEVVLVHAPRNP